LDTTDLRWLDAAARLAQTILGNTAENPASAALVVEPNTQRLVARAITGKGGRPHAEATAVQYAGFEAAGCTLYTTIEPCLHWGRMPPCADAIVRAGIMRVVIGAKDPRTDGAAQAYLESAGIEVEIVDHAPSLALGAGNFLRHRSARPFLTAVLTVSADNKIATTEGSRLAVPPAAASWAEILRSRSDAILVSSTTAGTDDPKLTVALPGLATRSPLRVVLAGRSGVDRKLNLIGGFSGYRTAIIAQSGIDVDAPVSVERLSVPGADGRPHLASALSALAEKHVQNLVAEPGQRLTAKLLEADLVDRFVLIETQETLGKEALAACVDGPVADFIEAAGLVQTHRQSLGAAILRIFERPRA
jgi:diaminohydroxyphosphoribosylaminopyrimidine deaminase/5-amino-6-(5-phosphoribosylamino)uracil reductase